METNHELAKFSTEMLEEEIKRRQEKAMQEFNEATNIVLHYLENPPRYIALSEHTDKIDQLISQLNLISSNWSQEKNWAFSDLCY